MRSQQFKPLAYKTGDADYGQVKPAPKLAINRVAVFMQEHLAGIVAGVVFKVGLYFDG